MITGATSGIGAATARALLEEGAFVVAAGRRRDRLDALQGIARADRLLAVSGNIDDPVYRNELVELAGQIDVLINAAGVLQHTPFLDGDPADWEHMWRTNVLSLLCLTQLVARRMADRRSGHIVNITSALASKVTRFTSVYASTKFAVKAISEGLRLELGEYGIRVTEVAPGHVDTEIFRNMDHPEVVESYRRRTFPPLKPEDVAAAIVTAIATEDRVGMDVIQINPVGQS